MADNSPGYSQEPTPKFKAITKTKIVLIVIILITVIGVVSGLTLILKNEGSKNEVLLSTTIKLNKTDSEKVYNYNVSKGDHIQIDYSTIGNSIQFKVSNSTLTLISVSGYLSWSYLWPPTTDERAHNYISSGRYTFSFKTLGDDSTVTIRIVRNPS